MQTVLPSEFKSGMVVLVDGAPHFVEAFHLTGTAQTKHKLHTRLRHLRNGRIIERVFAENERLPLVPLEHREVQFSYKQSDSYVFLDCQSYDEVVLAAEQIGDRHWFIHENEEYRALFLDGKLLDITLPAHVTLQVADTAPAQRGGSDATWKPAQLEGGLEVMVPLFIEKGERIRIETATRKYLGRDRP